MPIQGFSGLSKTTTKAAPAATGLQKTLADVKATASVPPLKSRAQQLREEAEAAEREEANAAAGAAPAERELESSPDTASAPAAAEEPPKTAPPKNTVTVIKGSGFGVSLAKRTSVNALLALVEVGETKKVPSLFPTLVCSGGEQGGMWTSPDWQHEDVGASLPQGKRPLKAYYLGYRIDLIGWPKEYDRNVAAKPCYNAAIAGDDSESALLAIKAAKNYQFKKKAGKVAFDLDAEGAGAGRPAIAVEVIVFLPRSTPGKTAGAPPVIYADDGQIVVLRTVAGYGPASRTVANLARLIDPQTQEIPNMPVTIKIETEGAKNADGSQSWPEHFFDFSSDITSTGQAVFQGFENFKGDALADPEFMAKYNDWITGADKPMNPEILKRLQLAVAL